MSSSSEAESPDSVHDDDDMLPREEELKKKEDDGKEEAKKDDDEGASMWRRAWNKTAFTYTSTTESLAASKKAATEAAYAKTEAAAAAAKAKRDAAAAAAIAKKNAATEAAIAKKNAATAAAIAKKEAAAAKLRETGDNIKTSTNNATSAVKSSSSNAAASVNTGFWSVVDMAKKAAVDPKSFIPGRASDKITLLHFSDVADLETGAARFVTSVKSVKEESSPLILFSGNAFSPSMMNVYTGGEHMTRVLNNIGVQGAVFGNHDFDYGLERFSANQKMSEFPWIISNVTDSETGAPLGGGKVSHILEWEGRKIGVIGLVEKDWLESVSVLDMDNIDFTDFVDAASLLVDELKRKGCEFVVALTHMSNESDERLAEKVPEIGIILGGHSQTYEKRKVNGVHIVKSGSNFKQFSKVTLDFKDLSAVEIESIDVSADASEDEEILKIIEEYKDCVKEKEEEVLGVFGSDLDGRFKTARTSESNLGSFLAEVMTAALQADCAIINAGTIRSNAKQAKGDLKMKDLVSILPMIDSLVLVDVTGEQIVQALENGVSKWPKLDARFPQVAGLKFVFDCEKPPGQRIDPGNIKIGSEYLDKKQHYRLATKAQMVNGEDGYSALSKCIVLVDEGLAPSLIAAVLNHLQSVKMKKLCEEENSEVTASVHLQPLVSRSSYHQDKDIQKRQNTAAKLRPKADGRIQQATPEVLEKLKEEKEEEKKKKKKSKRSSSPKDSARDALFDSTNHAKSNGSGSTKSSKKKAEAAGSDDLK